MSEKIICIPISDYISNDVMQTKQICALHLLSLNNVFMFRKMSLLYCADLLPMLGYKSDIWVWEPAFSSLFTSVVSQMTLNQREGLSFVKPMVFASGTYVGTFRQYIFLFWQYKLRKNFVFSSPSIPLVK